MNVYAASILVLIDELKKQTKEWQFEPLAVIGDYYPKLLTQKPDEKLTEFFLKHSTHAKEFYIKCKRYDSPLRIIRLSFDYLSTDPNTGIILYYRANGWKGEQPSGISRRSYQKSHIEISENQIIYKCRLVAHVQKTRKKYMGIYTTFKITEPETIERATETIIKVLNKSLFKCSNYSGNLKKSEQSHLTLAVNLDGRNFLIDPNYTPLSWIFI